MDFLPLHRIHQSMGARFCRVAGWEVPAAFEGLEAEYRRAREGVALMDRSYLGRVKALGADGLDLLNRIATREVTSLAVGEGTTTVLTSSSGRIIDRLLVSRTGPEELFLLTAPQTRKSVMDWIDKYTIMEDLFLKDVTEDTAMLCLIGPLAEQLVELGFGIRQTLPLYGNTRARSGGTEVLLVRTDPAGLPGYDLVMSASAVEGLWNMLNEAGSSMGISSLGEATFEVLRVEAGEPRYGHELGEVYNPLEAGIQNDISWDKGCYIGQEVIARLRTYHKVKRYLVTLSLEQVEGVQQGDALMVDGKLVGVLTTLAVPPDVLGGMALAYLRTAHVRLDTRVEVVMEGGGTVEAHVIRAPEVSQEALSPAKLLELLQEEAAENLEDAVS